MHNTIQYSGMRILMLSGIISIGVLGCVHREKNEWTYQLPQMPSHYHKSIDDYRGEKVVSWFEQCGDPVLRQYLKKMLCNNPTILLMAATVERSKAEYGVVRSGKYPNINLTVSTGTIRRPEDTQPQHYYLSLPAAYELDIWKKLKARTKAAFLEVEATEQDKQGLTITMVAELTERYYEGLFLLQRGYMLDKVIDFGRQINALQAKRYEEGLISKQEVYQSEQQLDEFVALRLQNRADLSLVEHTLKILMGEPPRDEWLEGKFSIPEYLRNVPAGLSSELLKQRPDLRSVLLRLEALKLKVWAANRDKFFPSIRLTAAGEGRCEELRALLSGESLFWSLFTHLTATLFDFKRRQLEMEVEKAKGKELLQFYKQTLLKALQEVEDSLVLGLEQAAMRMNRMNKERALYKTFVLYRQRYENGMNTLLERFEAEQNFILGKIERYRVEMQLIAARIQLMRALGGAWWAHR